MEENITAGVSEIKRLENKLLATNKKKLELQQKLGTAESKQAQLELNLLNNQASPRPFNYWPWITIITLSCLAVWLFNQPE